MIRDFAFRPIKRLALLALLLAAALLGIPAEAIQAAPDLQDSDREATSILLGEYVFNKMENGESKSYVVDIPDAVSYLITAVDEDEAIAFDLVVTDAGGAEVFNDIFETVELALEPGTLTLEFTAVDRATLEFFILGKIGEMSDDPDQPGNLPIGSIYSEDRVSSPRYGLLTVPATDYPQQVLIAIVPGEEDGFFVTAEGDDIGLASANSDDGDLLRFWTHGGDYLISAEPAERRSMFTLMPFRSGAPSLLALDEVVDTSIPTGSTEAVYTLNLDTTLDTLTIELVTDANDFNITLVDRLYDGAVTESSFGDAFLNLENVAPGTYYVIIETELSDEDVPYILLATGEVDATAGADALVSGDPRNGQLEEEGQVVFYTYEVQEPDTSVTVAISSDSEGTDFDLSIGLDADEPQWSSYDIGSNDAVSFVAPSTGVYYIAVESVSGVGDFTLVVKETPLVGLFNGEPTSGQLAEEAQTVFYTFEIEEPGTLVTIDLSSETEDTDFDLAVGLNTDNTLWSSRDFGSNETVAFIAPTSGVYYIGVESARGTGDFAIVGEEGELAPAVTANGLTWGSVSEDEDNRYRLEITEPGQLLTVIMISQDDVDLDLNVSAYSADGESIDYLSSVTSGGEEIVSGPVAEPGMYEVIVSPGYADSGNYFLLTRLESPGLLAGQWAIDGQASSQYGDDDYSALQATGAPDTPGAGDYASTWASERAEAGEQSLELSYEHPVIPHAIHIHETYNPGAVVAIDAYDSATDTWATLWEGEAAVYEEPLRIFSPLLNEVDFATNILRLILDTDTVEGWNQIDAVELLGRP